MEDKALGFCNILNSWAETPQCSRFAALLDKMLTKDRGFGFLSHINHVYFPPYTVDHADRTMADIITTAACVLWFNRMTYTYSYESSLLASLTGANQKIGDLAIFAVLGLNMNEYHIDMASLYTVYYKLPEWVKCLDTLFGSRQKTYLCLLFMYFWTEVCGSSEDLQHDFYTMVYRAFSSETKTEESSFLVKCLVVSK